MRSISDWCMVSRYQPEGSSALENVMKAFSGLGGSIVILMLWVIAMTIALKHLKQEITLKVLLGSIGCLCLGVLVKLWVSSHLFCQSDTTTWSNITDLASAIALGSLLIGLPIFLILTTLSEEASILKKLPRLEENVQVLLLSASLLLFGFAPQVALISCILLSLLMKCPQSSPKIRLMGVSLVGALASGIAFASLFS